MSLGDQKLYLSIPLTLKLMKQENSMFAGLYVTLRRRSLQVIGEQAALAVPWCLSAHTLALCPGSPWWAGEPGYNTLALCPGSPRWVGEPGYKATQAHKLDIGTCANKISSYLLVNWSKMGCA